MAFKFGEPSGSALARASWCGMARAVKSTIFQYAATISSAARSFHRIGGFEMSRTMIGSVPGQLSGNEGSLVS